MFQTLTDFLSLIALIISLGSLFTSIYSNRVRKHAFDRQGIQLTTQKEALEQQRIHLEEQIKQWDNERINKKNETRIEFLRELFISYSKHNWNFIDNYDFPGVFPPLSTISHLNKEVNNSIDLKTKKMEFGNRVVTLEHLNILVRVFYNKNILKPQDMEGFTHWANEWYENSQQALKDIFKDGDTYPLEFIEWLIKEVFNKQSNILTLIGKTLNARLTAKDFLSMEDKSI